MGVNFSNLLILRLLKRKKRREKEKENSSSEDLSEEKVSVNKNSVESIKVEDKGVYEVNLQHILEGETDVFSDKEGNYAININSLLKKK